MVDNGFYLDRYELEETSCQKTYTERNSYTKRTVADRNCCH